MLKDNSLEDGSMSFKLIVINDESTLRKHRVQVHASVLSNIDALSADVARVISLSFTSILFGQQNKDTPNQTILATLLTMFSLFDQCAVLLYSKLGETTIDAVFFGKNSNQTITNHARPEHIDLLLSAFGFVTRLEEESWRSLLTMLRGRIVHGQGVFFKSDLEKITHFIVESGFKKTEREIYLSNNNGNGHHAFDFMCFLLFASEKLTSLVRLIQCY